MRRLAFTAATLVAACVQPAIGDTVIDWNQTALAATVGGPSPVQARSLAIVHAAVYDAVRAVQRQGKPYAIDIEAPNGSSADAAAAAAAHGVLVRLVPAQKAMLDSALTASLSKTTEPSRSDGATVGAQVAERMIAQRKDDKSDVRVVHQPKGGAGMWQPTAPANAPAILAHWGAVTPFLVKDRTGLTFNGPPAIDSKAFARDFDEVKRLGGRASASRTADQTAAAMFWVVQTSVPWHAAARAASQAKGLSLIENARLFAQLSMAASDSQVICFDEKYQRAFWRPITAIRAVPSTKIGSLRGDAAWEPLLTTPPHPEYPSAHAVMSGAAEAVLRGYFGSDSVTVSVTFPAGGVTRSYTSFSQISREVENARVWGGIHFRSADKDGTDVGRKIGIAAVNAFPR
jgi:hypothetical protein